MAEELNQGIDKIGNSEEITLSFHSILIRNYEITW